MRGALDLGFRQLRFLRGRDMVFSVGVSQGKVKDGEVVGEAGRVVKSALYGFKIGLWKVPEASEAEI
jgi:hypothetical protein